MEVDRLGGEHRLQEAVVLGKLAEEWNVGIVAYGEDVGLRRMRRLLPESGVAGGDLAADDGLTTIGAAVGEESDGCVGLGGLGQRGGQRSQQIRPATKVAGANEVQRLPDRLGGCGDGLRLEGGYVLIEEKDVEAVRRSERMQGGFERRVTAFQLLPLHGEGVVEEQDDDAG